MLSVEFKFIPTATKTRILVCVHVNEIEGGRKDQVEMASPATRYQSVHCSLSSLFFVRSCTSTAIFLFATSSILPPISFRTAGSFHSSIIPLYSPWWYRKTGRRSQYGTSERCLAERSNFNSIRRTTPVCLVSVQETESSALLVFFSFLLHLDVAPGTLLYFCVHRFHLAWQI